MKPFLRLDDKDIPPALPFTADSTTVDSLAAGQQRLKADWNAVTARFVRSLEQGSRLENLAWRRWHMDRLHQHQRLQDRRAQDDHAVNGGYSQERDNEDSFSGQYLGVDYGHAPASEIDVLSGLLGLGADVHSQTPSMLHAPRPAPPPAPPPMPQPPPVPPPLDFSSTWSTGPPPSSIPPGNRIIATPSWTGLFAESPVNDSQLSQSNFFDTAAGFSPDNVHTSQLPQQSSQQANGNASTSSYPFTTFGALPSSSITSSSLFALPPTTSLFPDLNSHLASTSHNVYSNDTDAAPPSAFYSSYGWYQPVVHPYPRFLTPSPEPEPLPEFTSFGGDNGEQHQNGIGRDPFEAMVETQVSGVGSCASSPFQGKSEWAALSDDEVAQRLNGDEGVSSAPNGKAKGKGKAKVKARPKKEVATVEGEEAKSVPAPKKRGRPKGSTKAAKAAALAAAAAAAEAASAAAAAELASSTASTSAMAMEDVKPTTGKESAAAKKGRNPHATQLPGTGSGSADGSDIAGVGLAGPQCTHCGSVTTPLWRRGPDDELLCNACGLYQKLHQKPRPKAFASQANSSKRTLNGVAAQALASGIPPSCSNCAATSTPMWRKDAMGNLCCNACSLYFKLHNVHRPASLSQKRKNSSNSLSTAPANGSPLSNTLSISHDSAAVPASTSITSSDEMPIDASTNGQVGHAQGNGEAPASGTYSQPSSATTSTAPSPLDGGIPLVGIPRPVSPRPPTFPPTFTQHLVQQEAQQWGYSPSAPQLAVDTRLSPYITSHRALSNSPGALRGGWALPPSSAGGGPGSVDSYQQSGAGSARPGSPFNVSNDRSTMAMDDLDQPATKRLRTDDSWERGIAPSPLTQTNGHQAVYSAFQQA